MRARLVNEGLYPKKRPAADFIITANPIYLAKTDMKCAELRWVTERGLEFVKSRNWLSDPHNKSELFSVEDIKLLEIELDNEGLVYDIK
jgi:hypothetical protein